MQFLRGKRLNSGFADVSLLTYLNSEQSLYSHPFPFLLFHRYTQLVCEGEQDYNSSPNPKHLKARGGTRDLYDCEGI
jgi:hypothetical protein